MKNKLLARLALTLVLAELLLVLASWMLSTMQGVEVRSLLSGEGIRWLCGRLSDIVASPLLAWILFSGLAWGCLMQSGLPDQWKERFSKEPEKHGKPLAHRDHVAFWGVLLFSLFYLVILLLLTVVPHAILLSATGNLFPSPFSAAAVPLLALWLCLTGLLYGVLTGRYSTLSDIYQSLLSGLCSVAPLVFFYLLLAQLIATFGFMFSL